MMTQSNSNEWGTSAYIIEAARNTMSWISLDPASNHESNNIVKANNYFTKESDGFNRQWFGNVWLNPPYGKPTKENPGAGKWVEKLIQEYKADRVTEFCCLVRDSNAKYALLDAGCWSCEPLYRIKFINLETGEVEKSPQHNCNIYYLGPNFDLFADNFRKIGCIRKPA